MNFEGKMIILNHVRVMCLGLFPEVLREAGLCVCSLWSQAAGRCLLGCASPNLAALGTLGSGAPQAADEFILFFACYSQGQRVG